MKRKWRAVDSWALVKGEATERNIRESKITMSISHPGARVRTFKRTVRAGGASIEVVAIVAQVAIPPKPSAEAPRTGPGSITEPAIDRERAGSGLCSTLRVYEVSAHVGSEVVSRTWKLGHCGTPLFGSWAEQGKCRACANGWSSEGNRFASPDEIARYNARAE